MFVCIFAAFIGKKKILGTLLKTGLPLIKNVFQLVAKTVLIPLSLTAATGASAAGEGTHKKA